VDTEIFSKSPAVSARIRKNLQKWAVFQELIHFFANIGDISEKKMWDPKKAVRIPFSPSGSPV
jgi:hypothetical protein